MKAKQVANHRNKIYKHHSTAHNLYIMNQLAVLVFALVGSVGCHAFVVHPTTTSATRSSSSLLSALTNRQLQFWEDVEEGLDDIENFYKKKGQSIDRIRQFGKR